MNSPVSVLDTHRQKSAQALPWHAPLALQMLLDRVASQRYTHFMALQAELLGLHAPECARSGFLEQANDWLCLQPQEVAPVLKHPVFRAWMAFTLRAIQLRYHSRSKDPQELEDLLREFPAMLQRVRADLASGARLGFFRLDLDPLLVRALPPSYTLPDTPQAKEQARQAGHPLGFFKDVVAVAMQRIEHTWLPAWALVDNLVGSIAYLPDASFRSCSASRYCGLVLLSARDGSIFDLEESIVHEAGHQLLYTMVELEPICEPVQEPATAVQYKLPWSTQVRDIYGYYHAFFIYVLLVAYLERVAKRPDEDAGRANARLRHIVPGLLAAVPDFEASKELTAHGHQLFAQLRREVDAIAHRHTHLLATHV